MHIAGHRSGVHENEILLERACLGNHLSLRIQRQTRTIEYKTVIAADLIDKNNGNAMLTRNGRQHRLPKRGLAHMKRRSRDIDNQPPSGAHKVLNRVRTIKSTTPECFVVPRVLTDSQCDWLSTKSEKALGRGRREVAHLIKDVVRGQQALGLNEADVTIAQKRSGIHDVLSCLGTGRRGQSCNDGHRGKLCREFLQHLA
jgi:hypothetical protein